LIEGRLARFKSSALRLATNLRGWKNRRKLLVIESDDWGAIRMPGPQAYNRLLNAGIRVDQSLYDRLDCLENRDDFQALMSVIDAHHDDNGRPATFTFNTVMGNPDFEAIENNGFTDFIHQHMFDSYRHYHGEDLEKDWRMAIQAGLIHPQFHGREHLNSRLWMADLKAGNEETRLAFSNRFYGLRTATSSRWQKHYKAAYSAESMEEMKAIAEIAADGLRIFKETFHYPSRTFVACNYVLPAELEESLGGRGIKMIQTQRGYLQPMPQKGGERRLQYRYTGQRNAYGQRYSVRNVLFEPYLDEATDWVSRGLSEIKQAFQVRTPAIICTHRINYSSGILKRHRDRSLRQLDALLALVRKHWPDVEFINSDELLDLMESDC